MSLVAILGQPRYLPQVELPLQQPDLPIVQEVLDGPAIQRGCTDDKPLLRDGTDLALTVGQDIELVRNHLHKEFRAPSPAVEDNRDSSARAHQASNLLENLWKHFGEGVVGLGRQHEERIASCVVDPVVSRGWKSESDSRGVRLGDRAFAVVNADMAVYVEEAESPSPFGNSLLRQFLAQLDSLPDRCEARELPP